MWPMTVNLWSQLVAQSGFTPQATGTWTRVSVAGPQPPATYNANISFANVATGSYIYRYTVTNGSCTSTADVTVVWTQIAARANDECLGALPLPLPFTYERGFFQTDGLTFAGQCPNFAQATASANAPAQWGAGTFVDLWYVVALPPHDQDYQFSVTIDGQQYGQQGVISPRIAVYTNCNTLLSAASPVSGQNTNITQTITTPQTLYIRVGRTSTSPSNFSIIISI